MDERELRKNQSKLRVLGTGMIALSFWTIVKSGLILWLAPARGEVSDQNGELYADLFAELSSDAPDTVIAIAIVVMGITLSALSDFSNYIIPVAAIAGGLFAFGITLAVAEGAGGSATNYILAGTIVGFAFTSVQTIFLSLQKDNLTNVMWWLYGSFANITWENAFLVLIPALAISFIAMLWAREFNLFMSGEDQARQLGLNVRMFKAEMMVVASILTSVCVAFVGVIGFVGLVIPHACRMLMGGDHRLIMPASIVLGACLMLFADLVARTVIAPLEIPVGAVTALIGTPVFAYMLIRRGRDYDG